MSDQKYILAIDSGSTGVRAVLFNRAGDIVAKEYEKTPAEYPIPGVIEQNPIMMWEALLTVVKRIFKQYNPAEVTAIGICNQRGSFCLWNQQTGAPLCNFINWADVRAAQTVAAMNKNWKWQILKKFAKMMAVLTHNNMATTTSLLNFSTDHGTARLKWFFDSHPDVREECRTGSIAFGTLDTWFIYKLTGHKMHATDYSNAMSSGMLNPFKLKWNSIFSNLFDIPLAMFPTIKATNGDFGTTDKSLFEIEIPIRCSVGDQQAALFGQCCFTKGDVKISQGSGAFVDINVGGKPKMSKRGLFPLIAWYLNGKPTYLIEGYVATAGTLIDWLGQGIGLSDTPKVLNELAAQCEDANGVVFVPSHSGVRFPYYKPEARGSIFGLSLASQRIHVARAVFEGIAHSLYDILEGIEADTKVKVHQIKVDGGVSKSDILLQILSDYAHIVVKRSPEPDMTATGVAYFSGLAVGFWKDLDELKTLERNFTEFNPKMDEEMRIQKRKEWKKVIHSLLKIY
jgi:glycerol kinase